MSATTTNKASEKISLQSLLISPFIILILFIILSFFSFYRARLEVNDIINQLKNETATRIIEHLQTFLTVPQQINKNNANVLQSAIPITDEVALEHYFWQQIQTVPSLSSIYFGNTDGGLVDAGRSSVDNTLYVISTDEFKHGTFNKYALDADGNHTDLLLTVPNFDARTRTWYINASKKGDAVWNDAYILFSGQDMAIAASRPVYDAQNTLLGVVSVDLFLSDLSQFLSTLKVGKTGYAFIMEPSGLLIASSADEKPFVKSNDDESQRRLFARESASPLIRNIAEKLNEYFGKNLTLDAPQHLVFLVDGKRQFVEVSPVRDEYGLDWIVVVVIPEEDYMAQFNAGYKFSIISFVLVLIITIFAGNFLLKAVNKPMRELNASAHALSEGKWDKTIQNNSWVIEISALTQSFNDMGTQLQQNIATLTSENIERKQAEEALQKSNQQLIKALEELNQAQEKLVRQERLAAVGQLAGGIAHDFNNALVPIIGYADLALRRLKPDDELAHNFEQIRTSAERAAKLTKQILAFSRKQHLSLKAVNLNEVIVSFENMTQRLLPENINLRTILAPSLSDISADKNQIEQILMNLTVNARDAMPDGGQITIETTNIFLDENYVKKHPQSEVGHYVVLSFSDTGEGMDEQTKQNIFEPFFTTKAIGKGTGLGLATVFGIVKQHNGNIFVYSSPGKGTIFKLYFPQIVSLVPKEDMTVAKISNPTNNFGSETIFVLEDETMVRQLIKETLEAHGYRVLTAETPSEAFKCVERTKVSIDLLISDVVLPEMSGCDFYEQLAEKQKNLKVICMSGHVGDLLLRYDVDVFNFLAKPFNMHRLVVQVRAVLDAPFRDISVKRS